jgi:hypothetical protein
LLHYVAELPGLVSLATPLTTPTPDPKEVGGTIAPEEGVTEVYYEGVPFFWFIKQLPFPINEDFVCLS